MTPKLRITKAVSCTDGTEYEVLSPEEYKRKVLAMRLDQCTKSQRDFLYQIFPMGFKSEQLDEIIGLCDRTIAKNKEKEGE